MDKYIPLDLYFDPEQVSPEKAEALREIRLNGHQICKLVEHYRPEVFKRYLGESIAAALKENTLQLNHGKWEVEF